MKHLSTIFLLLIVLNGKLISQSSNSYIPPKYPTGPKEFSIYAQKYIIYPQTALEQQKTGTVDVTIYINKEGKVKLVRTAGNNVEFNNETKRVLKLSPNWTPGSRNNVPIDTMISLKVYYCMEKENPEATENDVCIVVYHESINPSDFEKMEKEDKERAIKSEKAKKLNEEGSILMQEKKFEEAVKKFTEAITLAGMRNIYLYNRGLAYLNLKQDDKAREDFLEAYRKGDEDSGKIYNDLFK